MSAELTVFDQVALHAGVADDDFNALFYPDDDFEGPEGRERFVTEISSWGARLKRQNGRLTVDVQWEGRGTADLEELLTFIAPLVVDGEILAWRDDFGEGRWLFGGGTFSAQEPVAVWPGLPAAGAAALALREAIADGRVDPADPLVAALAELLTATGQADAARLT